MGYRNYSTAVSHIVDANGQGDFTTIGAALTAASSGQTIFIRPGTYTENPTLKAGVNLAAYDCDALTPNVIINGNCTLSAAGTVSISGIQLQTNSANLLTVSGSAASIVNLKNCYLNCSNNTGISFSSSSASSAINIYNCTFNIGTSGIAYWSMSSAGSLSIFYCFFSNDSSSTASSNSAGTVTMVECDYGGALSTSSTGSINIYGGSYVAISSGSLLTTAGSGVSTITGATVSSGSASALSIGSGTTLQLYGSSVNSSNTNAITGAGTLNYGGVTFFGTSSTINTTTQNPVAWPVKQGGTGSTSFTTYGPVVAASTTTGALTSVSPSSTSGIPFISQGSSSNPAFGTAVVAGGGTGVETLTGLALGSGTSAFTGVTYTALTSFTPVLNFGGATTGITYSAQNGYYQRIGNMIFFTIEIILSSKGSATGAATITGLPVSNATQQSEVPFSTVLVTLDAGNIYPYYQVGGTTLTLYESGLTGGQTALSNTNFANTSQIWINSWYIC